jgi:uncharacterized integral membrane protein
MKNVLILVLLLFFISSCTMQKRRYNKGFHVEWFGGAAPNQQKASPKKHEFKEHRTKEKTDSLIAIRLDLSENVNSKKYSYLRNMKFNLDSNMNEDNVVKVNVKNGSKFHENKDSVIINTADNRNKLSVKTNKANQNKIPKSLIWALIFGVLSYVPGVGILAIIFAARSLKEVERRHRKWSFLAMALGIGFTAYWIVGLLWVLIVFG